MAIYLDEQTRPYLERLINKRVAENDKDFVAGRLKGALEADRNRLQSIGVCEHSGGEYVGHKYCCTRCGSYYEPGMGEEWELVDGH